MRAKLYHGDLWVANIETSFSGSTTRAKLDVFDNEIGEWRPISVDLCAYEELEEVYSWAFEWVYFDTVIIQEWGEVKWMPWA